MANQSDIQNYIQQLAGTHTLGQSNLPSGVNNGNPNTIYNQTPPQGGYLPPVSNGYDQWRINPGPNWQQLSNQAYGSGGGGGNFFPPGGGFGGPINPPPTQWGHQPPPVPPPGGGLPPPPQHSGGGDPPHQSGGGGLNRGGDPNRTGSGRGLDWIDLPPGSIGFTDKPTGQNTGLSTSIADPHGWGGLSSSDIQSTLGASLNLGQVGQNLANSSIGRSLGIKADGTLSVGEILDWIVPGNVYMAQTGKLNLLNMVPSILAKINPALGLAVKAGMTWLATHTNIGVFKHWLQRNQDNRAAAYNTGGGGQAGGGNQPGGLNTADWNSFFGNTGFGHGATTDWMNTQNGDKWWTDSNGRTGGNGWLFGDGAPGSNNNSGGIYDKLRSQGMGSLTGWGDGNGPRYN